MYISIVNIHILYSVSHVFLLLMCYAHFSQQEEEQPLQDYDDDGLQADGAGERSHYRENCRSPGCIIFSVSVTLCMYVCMYSCMRVCM